MTNLFGTQPDGVLIIRPKQAEFKGNFADWEQKSFSR